MADKKVEKLLADNAKLRAALREALFYIQAALKPNETGDAV